MRSGQIGAEMQPRIGLSRLFRQSREPMGQLPVLRKTLQDVAARCAVALHELASIKTSFVLDRIDESPIAAVLAAHPGFVWSLCSVPQWSDQACIGFDGRFLFRVLDAMYGGDDQHPAVAPDRSLSRLERAVCSQLATVLLEQLRAGLAQTAPFEYGAARVDQFLDASAFDPTGVDVVVIQFHLVEIGERVLITLPLKGLEQARERFETVETKKSNTDIDPDWSRQFQRSAAASEIEMVAYLDGPPMLLSDVAAWVIGSVVEFDAECLQAVRFEVDGGDAIFQGRLGQSKGLFTVCLESPLARPHLLPKRQNEG